MADTDAAEVARTLWCSDCPPSISRAAVGPEGLCGFHLIVAASRYRMEARRDADQYHDD